MTRFGGVNRGSELYRVLREIYRYKGYEPFSARELVEAGILRESHDIGMFKRKTLLIKVTKIRKRNTPTAWRLKNQNENFWIWKEESPEGIEA